MAVKSLVSSKTFWTGIASIVTGVGGYFTKTMTIIEAMQLVLAGFGMIFIRSAINK